MTDTAPLVITISDAEAEQPIAALVYMLLGAPWAEQVIAHGGVWMDGHRVHDVAVPAPLGSQLAFRRPPDGHYANITLASSDILYEDDWLIALNKPAGWYTNATPWDVYGTTLAALERFLLARDGDPAPHLHLAHRLDRDTSGVLLMSRRPEANAPLQVAFASRAAQKQYLCICTGVPTETTFELRTGHGRERGGRFRVYPLEQVGDPLPGGSRIKLAHTRFELLRTLDRAALLRAELLTGRTHQIRLHLAHSGHPLLGDTRYGGPAEYRDYTLAFHLLHAATLTLPHPHTGATLHLEAPLPEHFVRVLD